MGVHDNRSCVSLLVNCIFSAWFAWKVQRVDGLWQTDKFIHRMENWLRPYPQAFFHDFIKRGQWGSFKIIQVNAIKKKRTDAQRILKCKPEMLSWIAFYWFGQASMRMQTNLLYTITLHVLFFSISPVIWNLIANQGFMSLNGVWPTRHSCKKFKIWQLWTHQLLKRKLRSGWITFAPKTYSLKILIRHRPSRHLKVYI